jgi:hypothetical protein
MTAYDRLVELARYIEEQINIETIHPSYNGTQRARAYRRVLNRLKPIIEDAAAIRDGFNFRLMSDMTAPPCDPEG